MGNLKTPEWSAEKVGALPVDGLKNLRENALRLGDANLVDLCNLELERRLPPKKVIRANSERLPRIGKSVVGFHFVCDQEKGVTKNPDGTFWTGTWVVDQAHAERGLKIGAYVALHATKSEPSYAQGVVTAWREAPRESEYAEGRPVKIETGIDFLVKPTHDPYKWVGDGSGEKGYAWGDD